MKTREALLRAGTELLWRRPIDAIPVNDITEAAGVAKGSFFNHFADRAAFADAVAENIRREVEDEVRRANEDVADPAMRAARALCVFIRFAETEPRKTRILLRGYGGMTQSDHPLNGGAQADVRKGVKSGRFAPEAEQAGVLFLTGVGLLAMVRTAQRAPAPPLDPASFISFIMLTLSGLGLGQAEARRVASEAVGEILRRQGKPK